MAQVYTLTGNSLEATRANINGVAVDALDIDASLAAITPRETVEHVVAPADRYDIQVAVNVDRRRPIDPLYFGFNLDEETLRDGWTENLINVNDPRFSTLVGKLRPGLIRYPGGTHTVYWDRSNTVPRYSRPDGFRHVLRADDLDALVELSNKVGAKLYINLNLQWDDFSSWEDFARYCREQDYSSVYLCGGNEPNINGIGANEYATRFEGYYDRMNNVDPELDFVFGAPEVTQRAIDDSAYTETILQRLGSDGYELDFVSSHSWQLWGYAPDLSHPKYPSIENLLSYSQDESNTGALNYSAVRTEKLASLRDQYFPGAKVILGEYGTSTGPREHNAQTRNVYNSLATALWAADVLGREARAGADSMLYYYLTLPPYRSTWGFPSMLFHNDLSRLYPIFYTYLMFGQWWGNKWVLDVHSSDEARVSVNASVDGGHVYVMLINKTLDILNVLIEAAGRFIPYDLLPHSVTTFVMRRDSGGDPVGVINDLTLRVQALRDEGVLAIAQAEAEAAVLIQQAQARSDVLNAEADQISATITDLNDVATKARQVADELVADLGE